MLCSLLSKQVLQCLVKIQVRFFIVGHVPTDATHSLSACFDADAVVQQQLQHHRLERIVIVSNSFNSWNSDAV